MIFMDVALTKTYENSFNQTSSIELEEEKWENSSQIDNPMISSGISTSAELIQELINSMYNDKIRWQQALTQTIPNDIEKDVSILLPPTKKRMVKLHIKNISRPKPLLFFEE